MRWTDHQAFSSRSTRNTSPKRCSSCYGTPRWIWSRWRSPMPTYICTEWRGSVYGPSTVLIRTWPSLPWPGDLMAKVNLNPTHLRSLINIKKLELKSWLSRFRMVTCGCCQWRMRKRFFLITMPSQFSGFIGCRKVTRCVADTIRTTFTRTWMQDSCLNPSHMISYRSCLRRPITASFPTISSSRNPKIWPFLYAHMAHLLPYLFTAIFCLWTPI